MFSGSAVAGYLQRGLGIPPAGGQGVAEEEERYPYRSLGSH